MYVHIYIYVIFHNYVYDYVEEPLPLSMIDLSTMKIDPLNLRTHGKDFLLNTSHRQLLLYIIKFKHKNHK